MSGVTLAFISSFFWALNAILIRKGVRDVDPLEAAYVSTYPGAALLIFVSLAVVDWSAIPSSPWAAFGMFTLTGIFSLAFARFFYFLSVQRLGPSRSSVVLATRVLLAPFIGMLLLREPFTWRVAIGGALMVLGLSLLSSEKA